MGVMSRQASAFPLEGYHYLGMQDSRYNLDDERRDSNQPPRSEDMYRPQMGISIQQAFTQMHDTFPSNHQITSRDMGERGYLPESTMGSGQQHIDAPVSLNDLQRQAAKGLSGSLSPRTQPRDDMYHSREERYACMYPNCGKRFCRSSRLSRHMLTHTKEKPYACRFPNCVKAYGRKEHLKVHLLAHASTPGERKPFFCTSPGCDAHFSTAYHLKRHSKVHTKKVPLLSEQGSIY